MIYEKETQHLSDAEAERYLDHLAMILVQAVSAAAVQTKTPPHSVVPSMATVFARHLAAVHPIAACEFLRSLSVIFDPSTDDATRAEAEQMRVEAQRRLEDAAIEELNQNQNGMKH